MMKLIPVIFSALFFFNVPFIEAQVQAPEKEQKERTEQNDDDSDDNQTDTSENISAKQFANTDKWIEVKDKKGFFKVKLPGRPSYNFEETPIANSQDHLQTEYYVVGNDESAILVMLIIYPETSAKSSSSEEENEIKQMVLELTSPIPNAHLEMKPIQYKNHPAYSFRSSSSENISAGVLFKENNIRYILNYISEVKLFNEDILNFLLDHFELISQTEKNRKNI